MQNFAAQCLDMARSILGHNLDAINPDGTITPVSGEQGRIDEPGHAAHAIGEFYRATGETTLGQYDLVDLAARAVTAQAFIEAEDENGLAYCALGLLSFGCAKDRNPVWERLFEETRQKLDRRLLARTDYDDYFQAFNIAKSVARFSLGLSKKDETSKLIERFLERIKENSTGGYFDNHPTGFGGCYDVYGVLCFIFIRSALQLHANIHLRERKLPSLRTHAEKYLRLLPDLVRQDGLGWNFGHGIGAYGQMHCITLILQAMRDGWITEDQKPQYFDILRRLFHFFFATYLDQEHGYLVIRDAERATGGGHPTRMANFDAARYLCQWARLAKAIGGTMNPKFVGQKTTSRWIIFDQSHRKEQGLFIYQDSDSGMHVTIPLLSGGAQHDSDSLAFPHSPGVFDWPVGMYLPIMLPELTFGDKVIIPAYYGKRCTTGLGLRNTFFFRYEQPELVTKDEVFAPGLGSCKVQWNFLGNKITSEFIFTVRNQIQLDKLRYMMAISAPHPTHRIGTTLTLGAEGLRCEVLKDDFQAVWAPTEMVAQNPEYRTLWGSLHYVQMLHREHPFVMRPGQQYRLTVQYQPHIVMADE
jgi:hypothetical protein